jgi:membrane protein implicated in regulation of membrane protease activity
MAFDNNKFSLDYAEKLAILLEPFQEIEARMKLDDKDWFALKESADKKAKKIYEMIF